MKILIADDHRLVIEAVKAKLSEIEPGIEFVLAMSVDELLAGASDDIDLAVIDLNMPGAEGQAHVDEIRRRHPAVPVIVLSGYEDPAVMRSVLERGVLGFIPKAYSPEVMLSAVRLVLAGGECFPARAQGSHAWQPELEAGHAPVAGSAGQGEARVVALRAGIGEAVLDHAVPAPQRHFQAHATYHETPSAGAHLLNITERQYEVLALLARGLCLIHI